MEIITRHLCKASDIGVHGNLFGGLMLSWLDEAGAIMATRVCRTKRMVTVKFEEVIFHKPVRENHEVSIYGQIESIGTTSITLVLTAKTHDVYNTTEEEVCSIKAVFVRITPEGKKRPIDLEIRQQYDKDKRN